MLFGLSVGFFLGHMPLCMPRWGGIRIANGGDSIQSQVAQSGFGRDASYDRVSSL